MQFHVFIPCSVEYSESEVDVLHCVACTYLRTTGSSGFCGPQPLSALTTKPLCSSHPLVPTDGQISQTCVLILYRYGKGRDTGADGQSSFLLPLGPPQKVEKSNTNSDMSLSIAVTNHPKFGNKNSDHLSCSQILLVRMEFKKGPWK